MKVVFKDTFVSRLENQLEYIASNNPGNARVFKNELLKKIKSIPNHPLKHRKSIFFNDQNIRDLIFKGYTVVYRINTNQIEVFGFVKHQSSISD